MDRQYHDVLPRQTEIDGVGKPFQNGSSRFPVYHRVHQWVGDNPIDCLFQGCSELATESAPPALVPIPRLNGFGLSLRPEVDASPHSRSSSFRRTSSQGTAESGPSTCSLHRRSSSAASSGLNFSSGSRSSAERLSQRAIASSARSPAGSFRSSENGGDSIRRIFTSNTELGKRSLLTWRSPPGVFALGHHAAGIVHCTAGNPPIAPRASCTRPVDDAIPLGRSAVADPHDRGRAVVWTRRCSVPLPRGTLAVRPQPRADQPGGAVR